MCNLNHCQPQFFFTQPVTKHVESLLLGIIYIIIKLLQLSLVKLNNLLLPLCQAQQRHGQFAEANPNKKCTVLKRCYDKKHSLPFFFSDF